MDSGSEIEMAREIKKGARRGANTTHNNCVNCINATLRFSRIRIVRGAKSEVYVCDVCGYNEEYSMKNNQ